MSKKIENPAFLETLMDLETVDLYAYDIRSGMEYGSTTLDSYNIDISSESEDIKGGRQGVSIC